MEDRYRVRLYDKKDGQIKHANIEWVKQQTGVCDLIKEVDRFKMEVMSILEGDAEKLLKQKFEECGGQMDTRQLNSFAWGQTSMLRSEAMLKVIDRYKKYRLTFKSREKGKSRMWFLKSDKNE